MTKYTECVACVERTPMSQQAHAITVAIAIFSDGGTCDSDKDNSFHP